MTCGQPTCRCKADPEARHGPYWLLTNKKSGKTVTRYIPAQHAALYQEAAVNYKKLKQLLRRILALSSQALERTARLSDQTGGTRTKKPKGRRARVVS
jgi:hypothetical protein